MTVRGTSADLPVFDEERVLAPVSSLGHRGGPVSGFELRDQRLRALELKDASLLDGRIGGLRAEQASVAGVRVNSVVFKNCELGSLQWAGGRVSRAWFDSCKLLGARFAGVTLEHVVFTDCVLDYAVLEQVRAIGPVLFVRCSLREAEFAGCDLAGAAFDGCDLSLTGFGPGGYRGCDLRGNDLSAVLGAHHLKRVVIDRVQLIGLAAALAAELDVTFGDDSEVAG